MRKKFDQKKIFHGKQNEKKASGAAAAAVAAEEEEEEEEEEEIKMFDENKKFGEKKF